MIPMRIAVLMTCHNRREKTLASLEAVERQQGPVGMMLRLFLVDDGSSDGTGEAVGERYPDAVVLYGDGQLYWCGGMRMAFGEAMKGDFDYYLWLNDDTILEPTALSTLLEVGAGSSDQGMDAHIVVGSVMDPVTGKLTYGGVTRCSKWHPFRYRLVQPTYAPRPCETMNGNCVLISRSAARVVGNMDKAFVHAFGDYDYGLRAQRKGCSLWVAPGFVGACVRDHDRLKWRDASVPLRERWACVMSVKGMPPRQLLVYARRYGGKLWPLFWSMPYLRALFLPVKHVAPSWAAPTCSGAGGPRTV